MEAVIDMFSKMSTSHVRRQRKKLSPFRSIAAPSSARVLGDASFFFDFLVKKEIQNVVLAQIVIGRFLGKEATLYTTECVKAGFRQVYHDTKVAMCGHVRVLPPHECVASVVGRSNLFNFILATASKDDADEYIKCTGRPVILGGPECSLKVYATGTNANGEAQEQNPIKKNILHRLFRIKALKKKLKARKKMVVFKARDILLQRNMQSRKRTVLGKLMETAAQERDEAEMKSADDTKTDSKLGRYLNDPREI